MNHACVGTSSLCETLLLTFDKSWKSSPKHGARSATSYPNRFPPPCYLKAYISFSPASKWTTALSLELQAVGRLPGISCGSCHWCQADQLRPGTLLGASRDHNICRSHLQGSLNYQTTTLMPVCSASYSCGAQLTMQLSPLHALQHEAWLARTVSAPHVGDLSRRKCCSIVSAGAGTPSWWHDVVRRTSSHDYPMGRCLVPLSWVLRLGFT